MPPKIAKSTFVDKTAVIIGDVTIKEDCGVWPHAVIRGDLNYITIDSGSNIQDNVVVHVSAKNHTVIGKNVSIGHGAVIHGVTIADNCLIGMNATVLDGCEIGEGSLIGANALVLEGSKIPPKSLVLGVPGKIIKQSDELLSRILRNAETYRRLAKEHKEKKHQVYQNV